MTFVEMHQRIINDVKRKIADNDNLSDLTIVESDIDIDLAVEDPLTDLPMLGIFLGAAIPSQQSTHLAWLSYEYIIMMVDNFDDGILNAYKNKQVELFTNMQTLLNLMGWTTETALEPVKTIIAGEKCTGWLTTISFNS